MQHSETEFVSLKSNLYHDLCNLEIIISVIYLGPLFLTITLLGVCRYSLQIVPFNILHNEGKFLFVLWTSVKLKSYVREYYCTHFENRLWRSVLEL